MKSLYQQFLDLCPDEGFSSPAGQFLADVFLELDGILPDEDLLAAAQKVASR